MWFNYKAQRTLKKMQIEATLRISGCDIFRRERWVTSIRPVLVRVLGQVVLNSTFASHLPAEWQSPHVQ